ncbi:transmembrane protein 164-like [Clavelina lepadiformis]|uniref:transmembrane protein 164-like n=1 Tax=Clavelina lepadiformis TaxID=159417 RepID=UPI004042BD5B
MLESATCPAHFKWLYGGINFTFEGNGGPECAAYLSPFHRVVETLIVLTASVIEIVWAYKRISSTDKSRLTPVGRDVVRMSDVQQVNGKLKSTYSSHTERSDFKMFLLVLVTVVFGIEIGYKFATDSLIYLLNPCHILTFSLIYLLAVNENKPSKKVTGVFRVHLHLLSGALLAILLPVVNTRHLSFEKYSYWLHHVLIYIIPGYLLSLGGPYTAEPLSDPWWPMLSIGTGFFYHFTILQGLALATHANLNNMLCPAMSDPFEGLFYRMWAFGHQHLLISFHAKLYQSISYMVTKVCCNFLAFLKKQCCNIQNFVIGSILHSSHQLEKQD